MADYGVMLDTSFIIRLLDESDSLNANAKNYFKYFRDKGIPMHFSTISIAEFLVKGDIELLPLTWLEVETFTFQHAIEAGRFASLLFEKRAKGHKFGNRLLIPNDTKIFAQSECIPDIKYFVTSDTNAKDNIELLNEKFHLKFSHLDISEPLSYFSGEFSV